MSWNPVNYVVDVLEPFQADSWLLVLDTRVMKQRTAFAASYSNKQQFDKLDTAKSNTN